MNPSEFGFYTIQKVSSTTEQPKPTTTISTTTTTTTTTSTEKETTTTTTTTEKSTTSTEEDAIVVTDPPIAQVNVTEPEEPLIGKIENLVTYFEQRNVLIRHRLSIE